MVNKPTFFDFNHFKYARLTLQSRRELKVAIEKDFFDNGCSTLQMSMRSNWLIFFFKLFMLLIFYIYLFYQLLKEECLHHQLLLTIFKIFSFNSVRFTPCILKLLSSDTHVRLLHYKALLIFFGSKFTLYYMIEVTPDWLCYYAICKALVFHYFTFKLPVYFLQMVFVNGI